MNQNESFQQGDIARLHVDGFGALAGAGVTAWSAVHTYNAMESGDFRNAVIGATIIIASCAASKASLDSYRKGHALLVDTIDRSDIAESVVREQDPTRAAEALAVMETRLEEKKVALFEESIKVKKIEDSNALQQVTHVIFEMERPKTSRARVDKKLNYINCVLRDLRMGSPDEAIRYLQSSIHEQIRATNRLRGEDVHKWSTMLADAERDVRILEDIDYEAAARLRAEIASTRKYYLSH